MQIDEGNPNLSLHNYIEEVENMIPNHAFLRKTRKWELKFQSKLWISSVLQKLVVTIHKLFRKFIKCENSTIMENDYKWLHNDYKSYRNMISTLLKQSKKKKILWQVF